MKRLLFVAVLVVALIGFGVVQIVSAQDTTPTTPVPGMGYGRGMMGGMMGSQTGIGAGPMHDAMQKALADKLGLTVTELQALYDKGQTFWQVAQDKGFTTEQAQQIMVDARNTALDAMVKNGTITQQQADLMKSRMGGAMGNGAGGCLGGGAGWLNNSGSTTTGGGMMSRRGGRWQ